MVTACRRHPLFTPALAVLAGILVASGCGSAPSETDPDPKVGADGGASNGGSAPTNGASGSGEAEAGSTGESGGAGAPGDCAAPECECALGRTQSCDEHPDLDGHGSCQAGERRCIPDGSGTKWGPCQGSVGPALADRCDLAGDDSDCDGLANSACDCVGGEQSSCADVYGAMGECAGLKLVCLPSGRWPDASNCGPSSAELCAGDGKDEDCDGEVNNDCTCTGGESRPCGACNAGIEQCSNGAWGPCSDVLSMASARGPDLLCIPAGTFDMGSADPNLSDDTRPVHPVTLPTFWMDETEVTTAQYAACIEDEACFEPIIGYSCNYLAGAMFDPHPINCVNWDDADAFCRWAGKRLPLEEEWEYAARGTDGRSYAWGNQLPNDDIAHWYNQSSDFTQPVASYPDGRSPFGLYDMTGNVREWTAGHYCPYPLSGLIQPCEVTHFVRRGGDAFNGGGDPIWLHAAMRTYEDHTSFASYAGFRCAKNVSP